ncbi:MULTISPECIES: DUF6894 family protein [Roseovarius]|uniref:DUF6894 family protein n=1 Tax=Roseovarius TaxID=74030 RepID=UPI000CDD9127|nr:MULTISPECIES: hypothetical protein [Roseovarius]
MAHFYFDVNDGRKRSVDDYGVTYNTKDEAKQAAMRELSLIIRDDLPDGERANYVVTVRDETSTPIYVVMAAVMGESLLEYT